MSCRPWLGAGRETPQVQPGSSASAVTGQEAWSHTHTFRSKQGGIWTLFTLRTLFDSHTKKCLILKLLILKVNKSTAGISQHPPAKTQALLVYLFPFPSFFCRETVAAALLLSSESCCAKLPSRTSSRGERCFCWGRKDERSPQEQKVQAL